MNQRFARAVGGAAIIGTIFAGTVLFAVPAEAAAPAWVPDGHFTSSELEFLDDVHSQSPRASERYNDRTLVNAGYYACGRKDHYRLRWQVGSARTRLIKTVKKETNSHYFRGRQSGLAADIVDSTTSPFYKVLC